MTSSEQIEVIVCGNTEVLTDGLTDDRTTAWRDEIAAEFVHAACRVIDDSGRAWSVVASDFHDWRGGRHAGAGKPVAGKPWGYRGGFVACHKRTCPKWLRDLIDAAADAGVVAMMAAVAEHEAAADAA